MDNKLPRTFVIKFYNEACHKYFYLSRLWVPESPDDLDSEFTCEFNEAIRFTSEEAQQAHVVLRQELCDRSRAQSEEHFQKCMDFFGKLYIADVGFQDILDGELLAFLEWVKQHHSETLNSLLADYMRWQQTH